MADGNAGGAGAGRFSQGRALVVAIADYASAKPLPTAVRDDGRDLAQVLTSPEGSAYEPGKVVLLLDSEATLGRIRRELRDLAAASRPDDTVTVYFSGHGGRTGTDAAAVCALAPYDYDPADPSATLLMEGELTAAFKAIGSGRLLVFLDACHASGAAELKAVGGERALRPGFDEKALDRLASGAGRVMIASCKSEESSIVASGDRNSLFTKHLLAALRGQGPSRGDGLVRVFETFSYVAEAVRKAAPGRQHPIFKAHDLEEDFPIALFRGGSKTAPFSPQGAPSGVADPWEGAERVFSDLYPTGPLEEEIWARAGGDVATLRLAGTGRARWFAAMRVLRQGGGGAGMGRLSLVEAALAEFPNHPGLLSLRSAAG